MAAVSHVLEIILDSCRQQSGSAMWTWFRDCLKSVRMKQHILIVDDEEQIRDLLSLYLSKRGYQVSSAATSPETLRLLEEVPVDLVVLDIGLADEDGLSLLERLKTNCPNVLVVMLTGMGFVEDLLQEAHQKGADGYVSKVLPLDELLIALQRILKPDDTQMAC